MEIKDEKEMFTFKINKERRVVYEIPSGFFNLEDFQRFHHAYESKVIPALGGGKPFAIISDLRNYTTSNIGNELEKHVKYKVENGLSRAAIVVGSAIVKMQMKRVGGTAMEPAPFETMDEADQWLKNQGF